MTDYFTRQEAAVALGLSVFRIDQLRRDGRLTAYKDARGRVYFTSVSVRAEIERRNKLNPL